MKTKKLTTILLSSLSLFTLASCNNSLENYEEVTDETIIEGIEGIDLHYEEIRFDYDDSGYLDNRINYSTLWDGYDSSLNVAIPNTVDNLFNTYLVEYGDLEDSFYSVYLKKDYISECKDRIKAEEEKAYSSCGLYLYSNSEPNSYHFTSYDEEKIIDGKYYDNYMTYSDKKDDDLKYYKTSSIEDIKYTIDDYQLVMCAIRKKVLVKEDISNGIELNKTMYMYARYELDARKSKVTGYIFDKEMNSSEHLNQKKIDTWFSTYTGTRLEARLNNFKDQNNLYVTYTPYYDMFEGLSDNPSPFGVAQVEFYEFGSGKVMLPRYECLTTKDTFYDLLSEDTEFGFIKDFYGEYKDEFRDAFISSNNEMGFYDYDKVKAIIKSIRDERKGN